MVHQILIGRLRPVAEREIRLKRARIHGGLFGASAILAMGGAMAFWKYGWWSGPVVFGFALLVFIAAGAVVLLTRRSELDLEAVARRIEEAHPELKELLLTAVEQKPDRLGRLTYLQDRVVCAAVDHAVRENWMEVVPDRSLRRAEFLQGAGLIVFTLCIMSIVLGSRLGIERRAQVAALLGADAVKAGEFLIEVDPGDIAIERGSRLVVEARYAADVPAEAVIVFGDGEERRNIPMAKNLEDPVFGGVIPEVTRDTVYRIAYEGITSREFKIETFEYPELRQADATIVPPELTGLEKRTIRNTRGVSVMEGSEVVLEFELNKPVAEARLESGTGESIPLQAVEGAENRYTAALRPEETARYLLHLRDEADRSNKRPAAFEIKLKKNLPPEVALSFPGKDSDVSALQEMFLEAKIWDDVKVERFGATYSVNGEEAELELSSGGVDPKGKEVVGGRLALETLAARPDDSLTYFVWAEDLDGKGEVRRTNSDIYFADVRHFENTFKEQEGQPGEGGEGGESGGAAGKLIEMQKEIISATWNQAGKGESAKAEDIRVIEESQGIAIAMVEATLEELEDAKLVAAFEAARGKMEAAAEQLSRDALDEALPPEKDAYAELLKARAREMAVMRSQSKGGKGGDPQSRQRMELELKQKEQRYEEEKTASMETDEEQQENLQVLNRLRELARRQEALQERIKEIEAALAQAQIEEEEEALKRQLKRLEEEQEQLLRDLDDVRERMDSPENRARMAAERERLDKTREQAREAADELKEERLASAANAAARAERELEELRDEFQRKTSHQFAEAMREMRQDVRDLAEREAELREELHGREEAAPEDPFETEGAGTARELERALENKKLAESLDAQAEEAAKLMERMREVSESAEEPEPIVSRKLYDALRKAQMEDIEDALETAGDMVRYDAMAQARSEEQKASRAIDELKTGIEKAAAGVLGDEQEALRMARAEVDRLLEDLEREDSQEGRKGEGEGEGTGGQPKPGRGEGQGEGEGRGQPPGGMVAGSPQGSGQPRGQSAGGGNEAGVNWSGGDGGSDRPVVGGPLFFEAEATHRLEGGPISGGDYQEWTDRLRDVEEMLEEPELRQLAAQALDRARELRRDSKRNNLPPSREIVQQQVGGPLVELRDRVFEELARKGADEKLVPLDRDPVPARYRELVRGYFKQLGAGE